MHFGGYEWLRKPNRKKHAFKCPVSNNSPSIFDPTIEGLEESLRKDHPDWPIIETEKLPSIGNTMNDPSVMGFIDAARRLNEPNLTFRDPDGKTMEFKYGNYKEIKF